MSTLSTIHRVNQTASELFAEAVGGGPTAVRDGPTLSQFFVLRAVRGAPGGSQTVLTEATNIDRSTLANIARLLKKKGWINRKRSADDCRAYIIKLTDEGERVLKAAEKAATAAERKLLSRVPGLNLLGMPKAALEAAE